MSIAEEFKKLRNIIDAAAEKVSNSKENHKYSRNSSAEKTKELSPENIAKIAENRNKLREKVGDKPFEMSYDGSTYGIPGSMVISSKKEGGIKKLTIVNPIYQFDTPDTFKLIGGRMFERQKMFDANTGCNMVLKDVDIKKLSAEEVREIRQQQFNKAKNATRVRGNG